jgi:hypothetical protein
MGDIAIVQMDRIAIRRGIITVTFLERKPSVPQGVALKSAKGFIKLSNGRKEKLVYVWDEEHLPKTVDHEVSCPDGELRIWNIYKANSEKDVRKADAWTNNAGMIVEDITSQKRRYRCSNGIGEFDPTDLILEIAWQPL